MKIAMFQVSVKLPPQQVTEKKSLLQNPSIQTALCKLSLFLTTYFFLQGLFF